MSSVIVLAAGGSSRMGRPKALLNLNNKQTLLAAHLEAYRDFVEELVVVGGAELERLRPDCRSSGATLLNNRDWQSTMPIDSLRIGVSHVSESRCLVTPVDTVPVSTEDLERLLSCESAAVLAFDGKPGHPVLLGSEELRRLRDDDWEGTLQDLLVSAERVESQRSSICMNLNRPEDWERWRLSGFL